MTKLRVITTCLFSGPNEERLMQVTGDFHEDICNLICDYYYPDESWGCVDGPHTTVEIVGKSSKEE